MLTAAFVVAAIGLGVIVATDGSPLWRLIRVLLVGAATFGVVRAVGEPTTRGHAVGNAAAWTLATVHVVAGVGIGVRHAQVSGLGPWGVAGLIELAAGLTAIVLVAGRVLAPRGWRARVALVPGLVVLLALSLWVAAPAVMVTNVPPIAADTAIPPALGRSAADVRFPASGGIELAAWYVPSTNGCVVIVRHGASSTRADAVDEAAVLVAHGYGVLVTDARGHGASGGRAMDFGWNGESDLAAGVAFLATLPAAEAGRIGVLGLSMGAEEAIGAASSLDTVRAVVAEGATARDAADKRWMSDEYGIGGWVQRGIDLVGFGLTDLLTSAPRPTPLADGVADSSARFLLIAAGDEPDEQEVAARLAAIDPARVATWTVPGAGHTGGLATAPIEWERRVIELFDDALTPS